MRKYIFSFVLSTFVLTVLFLSCVSTSGIKKELPSSDTEKLETSQPAKKLTVITKEVPVIEKKESVKPLIEIYLEKIQGIIITADSYPVEIMSGKSFNAPFVFEATDSDGNPFADLELTIKYPSFSENGKVSFASEELVTDSNGTVSFTPPIPEFACKSFVSCYITPVKTDNAVYDFIEKKATKAPYKVYTNKLWSSFSISILDYSQSHKPIRTNSLTSSALLQSLYTKGLHYVSNSDWIDEIDSNDTNKLYTNSKKLFKNTVNYLIYGKVNYSNPLTTNDSGLKTTTWEISYNVMDMETGKNVLFGSFSATAEATDQWKLYDTIRREKIAPVITDAIYYGL